MVEVTSPIQHANSHLFSIGSGAGSLVMRAGFMNHITPTNHINGIQKQPAMKYFLAILACSLGCALERSISTTFTEYCTIQHFYNLLLFMVELDLERIYLV